METMKIAIIGGGSAGFLAAAHLSRFFPEHDLYHIYDPAAGPIGVGEGTLPFFARWLDAVTGLPFDELSRRCDATYKYGVQFEGWGRAQPKFTHLFETGRHAYHLSAHKLAGLLEAYIEAEVIGQRVTSMERAGHQAALTFAGGTELRVDFVFDARGFPSKMDHRQVSFDEIPTNAALVQRGPARDTGGLTRAVARPHGWIFVIPLASQTSYGYIYHQGVSTRAQAALDFDAFLQQEQVKPAPERRHLRFPSFMQTSFFDGVVFKIGNQASFLEPLEATAIGLTLAQLGVASNWLAGAYLNDLSGQGDNAAIIQTVNEQLAEMVRAVSLFVSWHYACNSVYDTAFWRHARACFNKGYQALKDTPTGRAFERMLADGAQLTPAAFPRLAAGDEGVRAELASQPSESFGGFTALSFAQIGHGIGFYPARQRN